MTSKHTARSRWTIISSISKLPAEWAQVLWAVLSLKAERFPDLTVVRTSKHLAGCDSSTWLTELKNWLGKCIHYVPLPLVPSCHLSPLSAYLQCPSGPVARPRVIHLGPV